MNGLTEREVKSDNRFVELYQFLQLEGVNPKMSVENGQVTVRIKNEVKIPAYMLSLQIPGRGKTQVKIVDSEDWQQTVNDLEVVEPIAPRI